MYPITPNKSPGPGILSCQNLSRRQNLDLIRLSSTVIKVVRPLGGTFHALRVRREGGVLQEGVQPKHDII